MKKVFQIATLVGLLITLIGAAFADSESIVTPVSIITIGLFITVISLINYNRIGETR